MKTQPKAFDAINGYDIDIDMDNDELLERYLNFEITLAEYLRLRHELEL